MPGELLMCVWEAVWAEDDSTSTTPPIGLINDITRGIAHATSLRYNKDDFTKKFKTGPIKFDEYKKYIFEYLKESRDLNVALSEIEEECWKRCKMTYQIQAMSIPESCIFHMWKIFNRLTAVGSYPPVMRSTDAEWLFDKFTSVRPTLLQTIYTDESYTFNEFLKILEDNIFSKINDSDLRKIVGDLYDWLVEEICMVGWLYKRTRKQANWTNWVKRWFVLYPGKLVYYTTPSCKDKKGEILITSTSKINITKGRKGTFRGRAFSHGFRLANFPFVEIDLCACNSKERKSWMSAMEDVMDTSKRGLSPVQALLQKRARQVSAKRKMSLQETENLLEQFRKTAIMHSTSIDESLREECNEEDSQGEYNAEEHPLPKTQKLYNGESKDVQSDEEEYDNNLYREQRDKIKLVFGRLDKDGNGYIDREEFGEFIKQLGLNDMAEKEINLIFDLADVESLGKLTLDHFTDYFIKFVMDESGVNDQNIEAKLRSAFLKADTDGTGTVDFREFIEFAWERKRSVRVSMLMKAFKSMDSSQKGEIGYNQFRNFFQEDNDMQTIVEEEEDEYAHAQTDKIGGSLEHYLRDMYSQGNVSELALYLRNRWEAFASFKRYGASGEVVLKGASGMVSDIVPGKYNLVDLACFSDLPPISPNYIAVKAKWVSGNASGTSGKVIFPEGFSGKLPVEIATNEHLRYYGCSLADSSQVEVSLLYRHGIQDFTYTNRYLEDYVKTQNGGAGLEKHEFSHLDCPLDNDSGYFILAKFDEESGDMHISAFKVPTRHTLYVPGGTIHSNDNLKNTWRTMLSDEAEIDHVHITRKTRGKEQLENFVFSFETKSL